MQGVVFSKNVTHRGMRKRVTRPCVLMLAGALEADRRDATEQRLASFDSMNSEKETMLKTVHKVCRFKPDLVLVEKSVSRIAQVRRCHL